MAIALLESSVACSIIDNAVNNSHNKFYNNMCSLDDGWVFNFLDDMHAPYRGQIEFSHLCITLYIINFRY